MVCPELELLWGPRTQAKGSGIGFLESKIPGEFLEDEEESAGKERWGREDNPVRGKTLAKARRQVCSCVCVCVY